MALPPGPTMTSFEQLLRFTWEPLEFLERLQAQYGDPFTVRIAGIGTYVAVSSPELVKQVFTGDSDGLRAGEANAILEPLVGSTSVLVLDGATHLRRRRVLMPPLHGERMHAYSVIMSEITDAAVDAMPQGTAFALHTVMQSITLQVILRAVFGMDEGAQMTALGEKIAEFLIPPPAVATFLPTRYMDFPGSPYRRFLRRRKDVDDELKNIVAARRTTGDASRGDILSMLLSARDEDGNALTDLELRNELMTMLVAGHETSATALSWTFACLLQHPDALERLHRELETARTSSGSLDLAALPRLEFLDAVVRESLRVRPILPDVVRKVRAPITVAGYDIPLGFNLMPVIHLAHRRAAAWPSPASFQPERFLGAKIDPYTWFPFGGGVRRCVGMAFALHEMRVVLATTLLRARFRLASTAPIKTVRRTITLAPEGGTRVLLTERKARAPKVRAPEANA